MHFKTFLFLISATTISSLISSCDNTYIEPQLQSNSTIDYEHLHLKLQYAYTNNIRELSLKSYSINSSVNYYNHIFTFDDGSIMTLETTYKFSAKRAFNLTSSSTIIGFQGFYTRMDFFDKNKNEHYAFKDQTAGIKVDSAYYLSKYLTLNFNNNYMSIEGDTTSKAIFKGKLAILPN